MEGLLAEGKEILGEEGEPPVLDAALIAAAQRVEHYEIAAYGCLRTYAQILGYSEAAELLQETLEEEERADETLTTVGEQGVNTAAAAVIALIPRQFRNAAAGTCSQPTEVWLITVTQGLVLGALPFPALAVATI